MPLFTTPNCKAVTTPHRFRNTLKTAAGISAASLTATPWLLRRMRAEFEAREELDRPTAAWMYASYAAHSVLYLHVLTRRGRTRPPTPLTTAGVVAASLGTVVCIAGMGRFSGPSQVTGTNPGKLATHGVYRYSRNPQYTGYLTALTGLAAACGSAPALALSIVTAGAFHHWVLVEESHLTRVYGQAYLEYRAKTRRWAGPARS